MRTGSTLFRRVIGVAFFALAACSALLTGCSDEDKARKPVRVLAPSIRTQDLVRWCHDFGISPTTAQWATIDELHDRYLEQLLPLRVAARERITDLFKPFDGDEGQSLELELRTERTASGVNRDFASQLAAADDAFLLRLADTDGFTVTALRSFAARRRLECVTHLFRESNSPRIHSTLIGHPDPIEMIFEHWPECESRDSAALAAFAVQCVGTLLPAAQRRWNLRRDFRANVLQVELAADDPQSSLDAKAQLEARRAKVIKRNHSQDAQAIHEMVLVLTQESPAIPHAALADALTAFLSKVGAIDEVAGLERAFVTARYLAGSNVARVKLINEAREGWRKERCESIDRLIADPQKDRALAERTLRRLLVSESELHSIKIELASFHSRESGAENPLPPLPLSDAEDEEWEASGDRYRELRTIGIIAAPPPRHFLRTIARLARLNPQQEQLFVDDAAEQWRALMVEENQRIERAKEAVDAKLESLLRDPQQLSHMIAITLAECVTTPLAHADTLDEAIAQTIADRAAAFGGNAEPARTLWRVVRANPPDAWVAGDRAFARATSGQLRAFTDAAPASIGVLACDPSLAAITRSILMDLLVEHERELIDRARELRAARTTSLPLLTRALILHQTDPTAGERALLSALRDFRIFNDRFNRLQESLVDHAALLLPTSEAHALRYRRTQLLFPELFVHESSLFAADRAHAVTLAEPALERGDPTLRVQLEQDDLALASAVIAAVQQDFDAQPTSDVVDRIYRRDEVLAEQSLRRIDRATRAVRDFAGR